MNVLMSFTVTVTGAIAQLRLTRPEAANALGLAFWTDFPAAIKALDAAGETRALIISAEGRHFCAGMDMSVFQNQAYQPDASAAARQAFVYEIKRLQASLAVLAEARFPVIAAIQGACIGAGLDLVSACDLRFAAPDAKFRIEEINLGMMADVGSLQRLPRKLPDAILRQMAFCGTTMEAGQALACGFLNAVHEDPLAPAIAAAEAIAAKAPLAVSASKAAIGYAAEHTVAESLEQCALLQSSIWHSPDIAEATRARSSREFGTFLKLEKRK